MKFHPKKLIQKLPLYDHLILPYHKIQAFRAATKYDYPASGLKVIGVTGTNGKTTTCFMIHRMLCEAGKKAGLLTTVGYGVGRDIKPQIEHMTTVSAGLLNKRIREITDAGAEFLVIELTSHALAQSRAFGVPIDVAVMTNVTHEHLDYHKTFSNYVKAKRRLFKHTAKVHGGRRLGVVNADDESAELFINDVDNFTTYGIEKGDLRARQIKLQSSGVEYWVKVQGSATGATETVGSRKLHIRTQIAGKFNVYNSLAAVAVGLAYGLSDEQIEKGIRALDSVAGRMNRIDEGQDFEVIIDFAHTPDAMKNIYQSLDQPKDKIITVFGLPGRRDSSNRPLMGQIAGEHSGRIVVTEDDSRDEDPARITEQIISGVKKTDNKEYRVIIDRTEAIKAALGMARKGDMVLLLGKGHEKTIMRPSGEEPWDEAATARKILREVALSRRIV
jgi:UDP-N-acetylmuramoyl-L-alanyl-D-glutamate--2,6-diaminopimelate ligase